MVTYDDDPDKLVNQLVEQAGIPRDSVADIRVITSWEGASSLEVDIIDPDFEALESDELTPKDRRAVKTTDPQQIEAASAAGHGPYALPVIDVNYPEGSDYWWRLSNIDAQSTLDGPNLTLTFETQIVAYLRHHHGAKSASRAHTTRAEFIKSITADEVHANGGIVFVSPEIDDIQPVEEPAS
jgi:hypothetical protein